MATTTKPIHYGEFQGICQCCWADKDRFGTLVDPNGHTFLICFDCIRFMWERRSALASQSILADQDEAEQTALEVEEWNRGLSDD